MMMKRAFETQLWLFVVVLGGVMVIVLANILKVRWFIPGRQRWIFKGDKISSKTPSEGK
jgi:hypothetical protein